MGPCCLLKDSLGRSQEYKGPSLVPSGFVKMDMPVGVSDSHSMQTGVPGCVLEGEDQFGEFDLNPLTGRKPQETL